jgi:hypothetical protein
MADEDIARFALSGDWTPIAPGMEVRLQDAPNEEDMAHYDPQGVVILQLRCGPVRRR